MQDLDVKTYRYEVEPDARGYKTFLEMTYLKGKLIHAWVDAYNLDHDEFGMVKSLCPKYNREMFRETGIYYRDAKLEYERSLLEDKELVRVAGAGALYHDLISILDRHERILKIKTE